MMKVKYIVIHCSATKAGQPFTAADIDRWHKSRGWNGIGYHYVIDLDGTVELGRPCSQIGAHCKAYNKCSIGVCYIGGLDDDGQPCDTRTPAQKKALRILIQELKASFPDAKVVGHRDLSEDINGDGIIEEWEWFKPCPCFDVATQL